MNRFFVCNYLTSNAEIVIVNIGCSDAIFAAKSTVNHFVEHGSCVYAAALDLKKASDRVNHFKLFSTSIDSGVPMPVVNVVSRPNWHSKLFAAIRWNSSLSYRAYIFSWQWCKTR